MTVKGFELHVDCARIQPFAEGNIDPKVLHRRIEELFDGRTQAVDLVDEEHRAFGSVRQIGQQVFGRIESWSGSDLVVDAQFFGNHRCQRRFADSRRSVEEDVPQRIFAFSCCIQDHADPLDDFGLTDDVFQALRPQLLIEFRRIAVDAAIELLFRGGAGLVFVIRSTLKYRLANHSLSSLMNSLRCTNSGHGAFPTPKRPRFITMTTQGILACTLQRSKRRAAQNAGVIVRFVGAEKNRLQPF